MENVDFVICQICFEKKLRLTSNHFKMHNLTTQEYKKLFPNAKVICENARKSYSKGAIKYLSKKSKEELSILGKKRAQKWWKKYKNSSEEYQEDYKKKLSKSISKTIQHKIVNNPEKVKEENFNRSQARLKIFEENAEKMKAICQKGGYNLWHNLTSLQKKKKIQNMVEANKKYFSNLSLEDKFEKIKNNFSPTKKTVLSINNENIYFRSKFEAFIYSYLTDNEIEVKYEPFLIELINTKYHKYHLIDFYIPSLNLILEAKSLYDRKLSKNEVIESVNIKKEEALRLGYQYEIIWYSNKNFKIEKQIDNILKNFINDIDKMKI